MELYLGESVDQLNLQAELPSEKLKLANPRLLVGTAVKLYNQAVELRDKGDAELSYVSFMKYLNLVNTIRKSADYKKDEKYYNNLLGPKNVRNAIENAENLQKDLQRRYDDRAEEALIREKLEKLERKEKQDKEDKEKQIKEKATNIELYSTNFPSIDGGFISSWQLEAMIKQKSTSFIIFDVRSKEDFENSHIKHPNCVSIPEDKLKPGLSAAALYKTLPLEAKVDWPKRLTADVIVLVDWFGENLPGSAIFALAEILTKWDPSSKYKGVIKLLSKGYDEWLFRFPMQTTNPHATAVAKPSKVEDISPVENIEYPDFDEAMKPPSIEPIASPLPFINRTTKPAIEVKKIDKISVEPSIQPVPLPRSNIPKTPPDDQDIEVEFVTGPPSVNRMGSVPKIDRNLKTEAMVKYLQDEEKLVEKHLAITADRLAKEEEWDRIRREKEASANDEIANHLQEREIEMVELLKKMENDNKQQELEIARLRKEVETIRYYADTSNDKTKPDTEETNIQARINDKEVKQAAMNREVERLRKLRKNAEKAREKEREEQEKEEEYKRGMQRLKDEQSRRNEEMKKKREVENKHEEETRKRLEQQQQNFSRKDVLQIDRLKDESSSGFSLGSKMNRSHSTPDLAQALQKESERGNRVAKVDRDLKPRDTNRTNIIRTSDLSKNRNFNPVYGNMGRGLTGLKNLGNTCYMNSILQCISNSMLLTNFFIDGSYRNYLNASNKQTRGEISDEVSSTLNALWSGQYRSISCKDLKNAVGRFKSSFRGYEQQDSHEFLTILVDWLHEELNEIRVKRPLKEQNNYGIPDEKAANMAWEDYSASNKSIIVTLFAGQQRSSLRCTTCLKESVTFEPFFNLSLPIPPSNTQCSIMDCFQLYTKPEQISGWSCPFCKNKRGASKKIDIWKLPPVLVVHLQRFYNDGLWRKRLNMVDFNVNELDLDVIVKCPEVVVKSKKPRYSRFKLYAVSNHYGTMDAGHYTAYCKNAEYNKWFKFDDQDVMEISGNEVRSAAAYILFYTAIDYQAPPVIVVED
ncbi:ubiquitin carboxyl-terminal hydrolase 8-like [Daphnia carinata]|uniref:ubiquitin carboxyl-terminal hydrolase 8-like n=1 Tax=Daphnia carinata TaxID=120202 RepID=UPI00257E171D|nr:ubiquitin carboxyl-terminal hydrolase 8-like [Daphnia carinata]